MKNFLKSLAVMVAILAIATLAHAGSLFNPSAGTSSASGVDADGTAFAVESVPDTACTATGTDAVCIGDGAVAGDAAGDDGVLAIGARSTATGDGAIAIGENTDATGPNSIAIGGDISDANSADATNTNSIAIGNNALASGSSSVALGGGTKASGGSTYALGAFAEATQDNAIAIGRLANATGNSCIAIGGADSSTDSADCEAANSVAIGHRVLADDPGEFIFGSGEFAVQSDAHTSIFVLRNSTTDATQTELFSDGSAGDVSVPSDCTVAFRINIVARRTDADNEGAAYFFEGAIDNNAGTTALIGTIGKVIIAEDTAAWDATVTADDTNDGINVQVTGEAAKTIFWVARAEITEVCG